MQWMEKTAEQLKWCLQRFSPTTMATLWFRGLKNRLLQGNDVGQDKQPEHCKDFRSSKCKYPPPA